MSSFQVIKYDHLDLNNRPSECQTSSHDMNTGLWSYSDPLCTSLVNVPLQLWRKTSNKKRALNKMPCDNKGNCHYRTKSEILGGAFSETS